MSSVCQLCRRNWVHYDRPHFMENVVVDIVGCSNYIKVGALRWTKIICIDLDVADIYDDHYRMALERHWLPIRFDWRRMSLATARAVSRVRGIVISDFGSTKLSFVALCLTSGSRRLMSKLTSL